MIGPCPHGQQLRPLGAGGAGKCIAWVESTAKYCVLSLAHPAMLQPPKQLVGMQSSCYACSIKVSKILRMLQDDGWWLVATRGSHRQYKHPSKPGRVTVPGKPGDDLAAGTLNSILKQAGLKK